jgi:hypothetical protein
MVFHEPGLDQSKVQHPLKDAGQWSPQAYLLVYDLPFVMW